MKKTLTGALAALLTLMAVPAKAAILDCNPTAWLTCGVPFPSDYWSVTDQTSPTGKRLQINDGVLRDAVLAELPVEDGFSPAGVFNGDSGFSAASAVVFEFLSAPDPATVEGSVIAIDLTTGLRVPVRAQVSEYAASDLVSFPSQVVEVFPRSRWEYGHEILVLVTDDLELEYPETKLMSRLLTANPYVFSMITTMSLRGIDVWSVRNATRFTVRDRNEVVMPVINAVQDLQSRPHAVRDLQVLPRPLNRSIAALVLGEMQVYNYRTNGGTGVVDFNAEPTEQWIPFRLTLPEAAHQGGAPVSLYAHGLGLTKESDDIVSEMNAELGIATLSVDFPNHGARAQADGGLIFSVLSTDQLAKPVGMMVQDTLDFASAHATLKTALADLDVLGPPSWKNVGGYKPDGVPDLAVNSVMMEGTSLGGVLGSVYGAVASDIKGGVYHVTGAGVTSILSDSILWESMFESLEPESATGAEALMLRGAIQQTLDFGDSINFMDYFRTGRTGQAAKPLMLTMGANDAIVTNDSTTAAAHIADLPIVGEVLVALPGVRTEDDFDDYGYGIRQYLPLYSNVPQDRDAPYLQSLSEASAHLIFERKADRADQQEFIRRFIFPVVQ